MTSPRRPRMLVRNAWGVVIVLGRRFFVRPSKAVPVINCGLSGRRPAAGAAGYYHNANTTAWPGRSLALGGIGVGGRAGTNTRSGGVVNKIPTSTIGQCSTTTSEFLHVFPKSQLSLAHTLPLVAVQPAFACNHILNPAGAAAITPVTP